ncbi:EthD domain-containing protein [Rhodoferax sp.]|uniref:EthD domain-containing protein n=1 Tax=Rhodoferax sp. TaxID=50421 RepID=UPI00260D7A49|nr:EthD domain-containing protein [Rhodoferax sp.]MDD3937586.1 EthD domain-containing protein [Rhodoferax sp.]
MPRKKLLAAMARAEGISSQEFHDHYRHPHGTMGMQISTLRQYVQSHQIHTDLLDKSQNRFEAIAELWFDNANDLIHFREEPTMSSYLNADEPNFCDLRKTRLFICEEEVLSSTPDSRLIESDYANGKWRLDNRPLSIKILQFIMPEAGPGWCGPNDEALGRRLGIFQHVRCHPTTPTTMVPSRMNRPPDFIGARELWWPTLTAFERSVAADMDAWRDLIQRPHTYTMLAQAERWR